MQVIQEYDSRRHELTGEPINTLYFGGGTPSLLPAQNFEILSEKLYSSGIEEFTIEVNPEDVVPAKVEGWLKMGVNRVSMGVQSLVDNELHAINRRHSAQEAIRAFNVLREAGIQNISCDLIYGLPFQSPDSWKRSIEILLKLSPEHISAYCLSVEPNTLLAKKLANGVFKESDDTVIEEYYAILCQRLNVSGYEHYEISNFAKHGFKSKHNSSYWDSTPYLGLGPGAHSMDTNGIRRFNRPDLKNYLLDPNSVLEIESENVVERINDKIFTGLRTRNGLNISSIPFHYQEKILKNAQKYIRNGLIEHNKNSLSIPENKWLVSDMIIRDVFLEQE